VKFINQTKLHFCQKHPATKLQFVLFSESLIKAEIGLCLIQHLHREAAVQQQLCNFKSNSLHSNRLLDVVFLTLCLIKKMRKDYMNIR